MKLISTGKIHVTSEKGYHSACMEDMRTPNTQDTIALDLVLPPGIL